MTAPLSGVTVVDISTAYSGPYCSMFLADMGADVLKVERPGSGDDARGWGPPFVEGESAWFPSTNRNKKSVTLDVAKPRGRELLGRLVHGSDVFLENLKPSTLDRLGLSYDALSEDNPRLVYCAISGFGLTGPWRDQPGYDLIAQALSGIMSVTGEQGGRPQKVGTALSDMTAGLIAAFTIAAALFARERTGRGTLIDVSLLEGQLALMTPRIVSYLASGLEPRPSGATDSPITIYQALATADRDIVVATGAERLWERFCRAIGLEELLNDVRFRTNRDRTSNRPTLLPRVQSVLLTQPAAHWLERLGAAGVPCAPIQYLGEVVAHPQVKAREMIVPVEHPVAGPVQLVAPPWTLGGERPGPRRMEPPPLLGQHTDQVLADSLGCTASDLTELRTEGVI